MKSLLWIGAAAIIVAGCKTPSKPLPPTPPPASAWHPQAVQYLSPIERGQFDTNGKMPIVTLLPEISEPGFAYPISKSRWTVGTKIWDTLLFTNVPVGNYSLEWRQPPKTNWFSPGWTNAYQTGGVSVVDTEGILSREWRLRLVSEIPK